MVVAVRGAVILQHARLRKPLVAAGVRAHVRLLSTHRRSDIMLLTKKQQQNNTRQMRWGCEPGVGLHVAAVRGRRAALTTAVIALVRCLLGVRAIMKRQMDGLAEAAATVWPLALERQLIAVDQHVDIAFARGEEGRHAARMAAFVGLLLVVHARHMRGEIRDLCKGAMARRAHILIPMKEVRRMAIGDEGHRIKQKPRKKQTNT
jgi:hypothetical protein